MRFFSLENHALEASRATDSYLNKSKWVSRFGFLFYIVTSLLLLNQAVVLEMNEEGWKTQFDIFTLSWVGVTFVAMIPVFLRSYAFKKERERREDLASRHNIVHEGYTYGIGAPKYSFLGKIFCRKSYQKDMNLLTLWHNWRLRAQKGFISAPPEEIPSWVSREPIIRKKRVLRKPPQSKPAAKVVSRKRNPMPAVKKVFPKKTPFAGLKIAKAKPSSGPKIKKSSLVNVTKIKPSSGPKIKKSSLVNVTKIKPSSGPKIKKSSVGAYVVKKKKRSSCVCGKCWISDKKAPKMKRS